MDDDESNAFARALAKGKAPSTKLRMRLRFGLGVALTLLLAGSMTVAIFLLGALVVRGVRHGDYWALIAAIAVIAMTVVMARGRAKK